ncbi:MAG: hypothetical protein IJ737_06615 [Ruminococcus sp.]|nr:hypothetical protein [Ruminococcus sp.]
MGNAFISAAKQAEKENIEYYKWAYLGEIVGTNYGANFPSKEISGRNAVYRFRHKEYSGEYSYNKNLVAYINGVESEIPYKVISTNYFELITNKMTDLVMNNDFAIKTGDIARDIILENRNDLKESEDDEN